LNEGIDRLTNPYENQPTSLIYRTKEEETFKVSVTEKIHIQKISLIDRIFIQGPYEAKRRRRR
jgi:hypothetical protein